MIVVICPEFFGVHGIARYVSSFLNNLPPGKRVCLLTTTDGFRPLAMAGVEVFAIPVPKGRFGLVLWALKAVRVIRSIDRNEQISAINYHFPPLIPGLALPRDIPMVLTAHTTYLGMSGSFYKTRYFESPWGKVSLLVKRAMEHFILRRASGVIVLTEQGRSEVECYGYKGPMVELPNGVDLRRFEPDSSVKKDIDVLFVGRIEIRKGSRPMVELCKRLVASDPTIRICIVGYGDDDPYVSSALAGYTSNIEMAGMQSFERVRNFYNRSKVYVSTSYYEGLPGTCLEAMAMQLPVVVWDFLFYRGLVKHGVTGFIAPSDDFNGMLECIFKVLQDQELAHHIGIASRQLLEENYDWNGLAGRVVEWIEKCGASK
jgi:glycosyltransferase involved in cell wall biosynthesis